MSTIQQLALGVPVGSSTHGALGWCTVGLLQTGGSTVLIDTGGFGFRSRLLQLLAERGVSPSEVTDVIVTHAHWDHLANAIVFPNARVHLSSAEFEWARRVPISDPYVQSAVVTELAASGRLIGFGPEEEVVTGVRAIPTPGHTPGHTSYLHAGSLFVGDAVKNRAELATGIAAQTLDQETSRTSIERVREFGRAGVNLMLGHDLPVCWDGREFVSSGSAEAGIVLIEPAGASRSVELRSSQL